MWQYHVTQKQPNCCFDKSQQVMRLPWWLGRRNLPASAEDMGSVPGSGRSPEKEMATHSSILTREITWTEEPGGLQSRGLQKSQTT